MERESSVFQSREESDLIYLHYLHFYIANNIIFCILVILKIGQGMPKFKPVKKSTAIFSFKRKQVDSMKQEPIPER